MKKVDTREIYSIQDTLAILEDVLNEQLGLGDEVIEAIQKKVEQKFRYVNWNRFQNANCPGCVSGPNECDIACDRDKFRGSWDKIRKGEMQNCPARTSGTMIFDSNKPEEGLKVVDIADHKFNVVSLLEEKKKGDIKGDINGESI